MSARSVRADGPTLKGPLEFPESPLGREARHSLMLGVFLNLQDIKFSTHPTTNSRTFDYNVGIIQKLPKSGYDSEASLDASLALGAMAATTKRILLISTMHVLYGPLHPLHTAKYGATLDHIAKGRWGINVVIGHRAIEHEMPGWQRSEHDKRYAMAGELFDITNSLWGETEILLIKEKSTPANAAGSPAGTEFAARYSNLIFVTSPGGAHIDSALETLSDHIKNIKAAAQAVGRDVKIIINPMIVSRDTLEELEGYALIL
ncbi:methanesulfonate monooxygenase [Seiridium cupressi]